MIIASARSTLRLLYKPIVELSQCGHMPQQNTVFVWCTRRLFVVPYCTGMHTIPVVVSNGEGIVAVLCSSLSHQKLSLSPMLCGIGREMTHSQVNCAVYTFVVVLGL